MNIGIFTDTYYPEVNGVANSAFQLKSELEKKGHTVYVFTIKNPYAENLKESNVFRISSVPFLLLKERRVGYTIAKLWRRKIKSLHLDLIHTQTEFTMGHLGRKASQYLEIPHVHTYHTIYEDYAHYFKRLGNNRLKEVLRKFSRYCCNRADEVIVPTEKIKILLENYNVVTRIKVIPTGIKMDQFSSPDKLHAKEISKHLGLTEDNNVLIYVGRVSEEKSIEELIKYFVKIKIKDEQARFVIVGDGPEKTKLIDLRNSLGLEKEILFTGMVEWSKVQDYYAIGDIFVSSSTSETQGLTYAEALAAGVPILVRKDACLKDVLVQNENGIGFENQNEFVEGYEYLINRLKDKDYRGQVVKSISHLESSQLTNEIIKVYIELLRKGNGYVEEDSGISGIA